jgi:uncharacterized protein (DUF433 family)
MSSNGLSGLIVHTPGACGGRARINGRRIPVSSVYRWFLSGFSPEDILAKYQGITLAQVYAAIAYALANRQEIAAEIAHEDELAAAMHTAALSDEEQDFTAIQEAIADLRAGDAGVPLDAAFDALRIKHRTALDA